MNGAPKREDCQPAGLGLRCTSGVPMPRPKNPVGSRNRGETLGVPTAKGTMPPGYSVRVALVLTTNGAGTATGPIPLGSTYLTPPSTAGVPKMAVPKPCMARYWRQFQILAVPNSAVEKPCAWRICVRFQTTAAPNNEASKPGSGRTILVFFASWTPNPVLTNPDGVIASPARCTEWLPTDPAGMDCEYTCPTGTTPQVKNRDPPKGAE